jgi:hypothetical protein
MLYLTSQSTKWYGFYALAFQQTKIAAKPMGEINTQR